MNKELGAGKIRQESIGENIDINKINQIYLSNLEIFKKLIVKSFKERRPYHLFSFRQI